MSKYCLQFDRKKLGNLYNQQFDTGINIFSANFWRSQEEKVSKNYFWHKNLKKKALSKTNKKVIWKNNFFRSPLPSKKEIFFLDRRLKNYPHNFDKHYYWKKFWTNERLNELHLFFLLNAITIATVDLNRFLIDFISSAAFFSHKKKPSKDFFNLHLFHAKCPPSKKSHFLNRRKTRPKRILFM